MPKPPATPPTCGCVACTPLSITATWTPRPVSSARYMVARLKGSRSFGVAGARSFQVLKEREAFRRAILDDGSVRAQQEHAVRVGRKRHAVRNQHGRPTSHDAI